MSQPSHESTILDQFTRQAVPFNTAATITNERALAMIVEAAEVGPDDTVLDVACGGGIIVCAFAPHVWHATGIDMTPAMLEQSRKLAGERGFANVTWEQGDVTTLPFADASFSVVVTRYSFHHFLEPLTVFKEMVRVCKPDGRILVVDMYASEEPAKAAEWNRLEKLRDPSHVRCLSLTELKGLFGKVGLSQPKEAFYDIRDTVKAMLARSFPDPGDGEKVTEMFAASAKDGRLGVEAYFEAGELRYAYPVAILSAGRV
jgi:ubiquinone/menaquinone biosynthesis C-methylase UbiE